MLKMRYGFENIQNKWLRRLAIVMCYPIMVVVLPPIPILEGAWKGFVESFSFAKDLTIAFKELW